MSSDLAEAVVSSCVSEGESIATGGLCQSWHRLGRVTRGLSEVDRDAFFLVNADKLEWMRRVLADRVDELEPHQLAAATHGIVGCKYKPGMALLPTIARRASESVASFGSLEVSVTLWAFATARHRDPALFPTFALSALWRLNEFSNSELAMLSWACTQFEHPPKGPEALLLGMVASLARDRAESLSEGDLVLLLLAFARTNAVRKADVRALFGKLGRVQVPRLPSFTPRNLSVIAYAYAKSRCQARPLLVAIAKAARPQIHDLTPDQLATLLWAQGQMRFFVDPKASDDVHALFAEAVSILTEHVHTMPAGAVSHALQAYADAPFVDSGDFVEPALGRLRSELPSMNWKELFALLIAVSKMNNVQTGVVNELASALLTHVSQIPTRVLAQVGSSCAALELYDHEITSAIAHRVNAMSEAAVRGAGMSALSALSIFSSAVVLDAQGLGVPHIRPEIVAAVREAGLRSPMSSRWHRSVSKTLRTMGVHHNNEFVVEDHGLDYVVDIALARRKLAIEVNGLMHYDASQHLLPRTRLKYRLLRHAGWEVRQIPWHQWRDLATPADEVSFLRELLRH